LDLNGPITFRALAHAPISSALSANRYRTQPVEQPHLLDDSIGNGLLSREAARVLAVRVFAFDPTVLALYNDLTQRVLLCEPPSLVDSVGLILGHDCCTLGSSPLRSPITAITRFHDIDDTLRHVLLLPSR